jgi:predicted RNA-binding protein associated with RNAse of E/G family
MIEGSDDLETTDHALDVIVEPAGTWGWKDEDDFTEAQELGVFTPSEASPCAQRASA